MRKINFHPNLHFVTSSKSLVALYQLLKTSIFFKKLSLYLFICAFYPVYFTDISFLKNSNPGRTFSGIRLYFSSQFSSKTPLKCLYRQGTLLTPLAFKLNAVNDVISQKNMRQQKKYFFHIMRNQKFTVNQKIFGAMVYNSYLLDAAVGWGGFQRGTWSF